MGNCFVTCPRLQRYNFHAVRPDAANPRARDGAANNPRARDGAANPRARQVHLGRPDAPLPQQHLPDDNHGTLTTLPSPLARNLERNPGVQLIYRCQQEMLGEIADHRQQSSPLRHQQQKTQVVPEGTVAESGRFFSATGSTVAGGPAAGALAHGAAGRAPRLLVTDLTNTMPQNLHAARPSAAADAPLPIKPWHVAPKNTTLFSEQDQNSGRSPAFKKTSTTDSSRSPTKLRPLLFVASPPVKSHPAGNTDGGGGPQRGGGQQNVVYMVSPAAKDRLRAAAKKCSHEEDPIISVGARHPLRIFTGATAIDDPEVRRRMGRGGGGVEGRRIEAVCGFTDSRGRFEG